MPPVRKLKKMADRKQLVDTVQDFPFCNGNRLTDLSKELTTDPKRHTHTGGIVSVLSWRKRRRKDEQTDAGRKTLSEGDFFGLVIHNPAAGLHWSGSNKPVKMKLLKNLLHRLFPSGWCVMSMSCEQ